MIYTKNYYNEATYGDLFGWAVSPVSHNRGAIAATLTLTNKDAGWQIVSPTTPQDIVLPDATTLNDAFETQANQVDLAGRIFGIHNAGTAVATVKDGAGNVLKTVDPSTACKFVLEDAQTVAGVWFAYCLVSGVPPYIATYATTDFVLVGTPPNTQYEFAIPESTHGQGLDCEVFVEDTNGDRVEPLINIDRTTGDVTLIVNDTPDGRYNGRIRINK